MGVGRSPCVYNNTSLTSRGSVSPPEFPHRNIGQGSFRMRICLCDQEGRCDKVWDFFWSSENFIREFHPG